MATRDELQDIVARMQQFFLQQRELYGDGLPSPAPEPSDAVPAAREQPKEAAEITTMKKPPMVKEQKNLFGEPDAAASASLPVPTAYPDEPWTGADSLARLDEMINTCTKCGLGQTRTKFVFGVGNPHAGLVLIGEAPGADEDAQGEPFVGRAGQLLNKILEAIGFQRNEVYICNILKCRPPGNREPATDEVALCEPYLWKQLDLIKPKVILCLGRVAAKALLKTNEALGAMREHLYDYRGAKVVVTYHPAALLRNPHWKRPAWEDVQKARKLYDELTAAHARSEER